MSHTRLRYSLVKYAVNATGPEGTSTRLRVKLTHQEMANLIGCSRETVSATLGQFRNEGIIRVEGRSLTIVNANGLSRLLA